MNYFQNIISLDEAKKRFYELAKIHHPDKGGDTATFQTLLNQFHDFTPEKEKFKGEVQDWNSKEYANIILQLIKIPEVVIEICGSWIWLHGNTKPYKELIKSIDTGDKYRRGWSQENLMWYFSPAGFRKKSSSLSIDKIRRLYGSVKIDDKSYEKKLTM